MLLLFLYPHCHQKRSREGRNVGFDVPDNDDVETISEGDLEFHKRVSLL